VTVEDETAWLDALAGRVDPPDPASSSIAPEERVQVVQEALALRAFIRAQEIKIEPAMPTIDAVRERELIDRARAAGLVRSAPPARGAPYRLRSFFSSRAGFAAAATVIVAIGATRLWRSTLPQPEALRGILGGTVHLETRDPLALKRRLVEELTAVGVSVSGYARFGHLGIDADLPLPVSAAVAHVLERHHIPVPSDGALVVEIDPPVRR
jgi:hypothetical protein